MEVLQAAVKFIIVIFIFFSLNIFEGHRAQLLCSLALLCFAFAYMIARFFLKLKNISALHD